MFMASVHSAPGLPVGWHSETGPLQDPGGGGGGSEIIIFKKCILLCFQVDTFYTQNHVNGWASVFLISV